MEKKKALLKLIIPSLLGILFFLVPIRFQGSTELIVGIMGNAFKQLMGDALVPLLVVLIVLDAAISVIHRFAPIPFLSRHKSIHELFSPSTFWLITRVVGAVFAVLTYFRLGTEVIWSGDTGGSILGSILPSCIMWYVIGGLFLSLLTDYGLMDILSSLFTRVSRFLFCVPGRAMIDCVTSWLGSSVCGTYLTISQYENGFYSAKEAAIIICNFSLLSVSFCSLIAEMLGFNQIFGKFYLTVVIASFLCAVILPRIPPMRRMPESYDPVCGKQIQEDIPAGIHPLKWGYRQALAQAEKAPGLSGFLRSGCYNVVSLVVSTLPNIMAFGTIALIVGTYTNVFDYLGIPLGLYLELFKIPEAMEAGSAILVGFADQFIPVIIGTSMTHLSTRFLLGTLSIIQIIYIADIGTLVLTSRVPLSLWKLFVIFVERILLSIPVVVLCMRLFGIA